MFIVFSDDLEGVHLESDEEYYIECDEDALSEAESESDTDESEPEGSPRPSKRFCSGLQNTSTKKSETAPEQLRLQVLLSFLWYIQLKDLERLPESVINSLFEAFDLCCD